jgi:hypothetical protein
VLSPTRGNLRFNFWIANDQPAAAGDIGTGRCLFRQVNALRNDSVGNLALEIETQTLNALCVQLDDYLQPYAAT